MNPFSERWFFLGLLEYCERVCSSSLDVTRRSQTVGQLSTGTASFFSPSSSLWVVLSGSEKTSVVKCSRIPIGPQTAIITLGLSTGAHPPVEGRWLVDLLGGAELTFICIQALSGKQGGGIKRRRDASSVGCFSVALKMHSIRSHKADITSTARRGKRWGWRGAVTRGWSW